MSGYEMIHKEGSRGGEVEMHQDDAPVARATWYYKEDLGAIAIDHVLVIKDLQGKGIGTLLMKELVQMIRNKQLKLYPECTFAREFVSENENELSDILI